MAIVNAIAPGAVEGERIQRVFQGRAEATGKSLDEVKEIAMANQSIKRLVEPADIAALAVFLAPDAGRSISGQVLPSGLQPSTAFRKMPARTTFRAV